MRRRKLKREERKKTVLVSFTPNAECSAVPCNARSPCLLMGFPFSKLGIMSRGVCRIAKIYDEKEKKKACALQIGKI
jgi:hypothetical protein